MTVRSYIGVIRRADGKRFRQNGQFTVSSVRFELAQHAENWTHSMRALGVEIVGEVVPSSRKPEITAAELK